MVSSRAATIGLSLRLECRLEERAELARDVEEISASREATYQPYWAARGHLLELLNRQGEAQQAFTRAASVTDDPALREYLFERAAENA